jgi:hypothetical protein
MDDDDIAAELLEKVPYKLLVNSALSDDDRIHNNRASW